MAFPHRAHVLTPVLIATLTLMESQAWAQDSEDVSKLLATIRIRTDPNAPDTDGDGISDGEDPFP